MGQPCSNRYYNCRGKRFVLSFPYMKRREFLGTAS